MMNELEVLGLFLEEYVKAKEELNGVDNMMNDIFVTDKTSIHVFEGDELVGIYTKESGVPKIHVEEEPVEEDGSDRDGDILDKDWAKNRNKEIEEEVRNLRSILSNNYVSIGENEEIRSIISELLQERDENYRRYGLDGEGDGPDKPWAKNRNIDIETEVAGLREYIKFLNDSYSDIDETPIVAMNERIEDLLEERDQNTRKYGLAGTAFNDRYDRDQEEKSIVGREFTDDELLDPNLLVREEYQEEKNTEEKLMDTLDRINNSHDIQEWIDKHTWNNHYVGRPFVYVDDIQELLLSKQGVESDVSKGSEDSLYDKLISSGIPMSVIEEKPVKSEIIIEGEEGNYTAVEQDMVEEPPKVYSHKPNDNEARFKKITKEMVELYSRKNTDYGGSFDESLDEDGLLVAKIRLKDKLNRFSQLIDNDGLVEDESLRDTLIDLANYSVMTIMWLDGEKD